MKANIMLKSALLTSALIGFASLSAPSFSAENSALWKYQVKGDFNTVLTQLKSGLEAHQFQITGEENLSKGLENNKNIWGENKWNTIGFQNVTAVHFCSLVFNQEVYNVNMDWAVLCPFKAVVYNMKAKPGQITIQMTRPTYLMAQDPHPKAKEVGKKIEDRIVAAIKEAVAH